MIYKTKFKDLLIIKNKKYKDSRGFFMELLKNKDLKKNFPFVVCSYSKKMLFVVSTYKHKDLKVNIYQS
tara:strand:- start:150 stop:356 length:207 start_codon:yes stop_codon:yes gene_type:complete